MAEENTDLKEILRQPADRINEIRIHADRILDRYCEEIRGASERIKKNIRTSLPYLVDLYAGSDVIAVAEIGQKYCVVDSGNSSDVERRMIIRTSFSGDLHNFYYKIFKLAEITRNGHSKKFLGLLTKLNNEQAKY